MLNLRPYQRECTEAIKNISRNGTKRQLVSLPTAAGKTVIFAFLIKELNCPALIIAHTTELLKQAEEKLRMIEPNLDIGFVDGDRKEFNAQVVIASIQSARVDANLEQLVKRNFPILIYDECHHAAADGARKVIDRLGFGQNTKKLLVGFTATAFREDGKGLGEVFDAIAFEKDTKSMIDEGWLVRPQGFKIATDVNLASVKSVDGDFVQASLAKVMDTLEMNSLIIESYIKRAYGKQAICFGVSVDHAKNLAAGFMARGIASKAISGETPRQEREQTIQEYRDGKITVLSNCQVLTEGIDLPETECIIVARPTRSKGLYVQMVGRGLRLWPNKKECVLLDFGDRNHTVCNAAMLLSDASEKPNTKYTKRDMLRELPVKLNPKLKVAIVSHDPLGESFVWERGDNKTYFMRGAGSARLSLVLYGKDKYSVIYQSETDYRIVAEGLSFEWAFSTAEDFAKANRKLFALSDKEAEWRKQPISDKQKETLRKCGFKAGIDQLTRGQASAIMQSGVLWRR